MGAPLRALVASTASALVLLAWGGCSGDAAPAEVVEPAACGPVDLDASSAPDPGAPAPGPSATDRLFDDHAPPAEFQILVDPTDWAWLQDNATLEQYVPASVVHQGRRVDGAAVRYKGGYGSLHACFEGGVRSCDKLSLKVSFNEVDKKGRFEGVRKLVFNSCNRDDSCLHERVSYSLFRDAGLVSGRAVHALVRVNDEPASLYLLVENVDKEYLEDHFDDPEGNLYKEAWPTPEAAPSEWADRLRTNEAEADVSRMAAFADVLAATTDATFLADVAPYIDAAAMLRFFVVDQVIHNWDGIWKFYCQGEHCRNHNYYLYEQPGSQRVTVIPWDLDHTFNRPNDDLGRSWHDLSPGACDVEIVNGWIGIRAPQCDPLLSGLMRLQWDAYVAEVDALTAPGAPLSEEAMLARLDRYRAMILPHIAADPLGPSLDDWRRAVTQMRQVARLQHRLAREFVAEQAGR